MKHHARRTRGDDTDRLQAFLDSGGGLLSPGRYHISRTLVMPVGAALHGEEKAEIRKPGKLVPLHCSGSNRVTGMLFVSE